MEFEIVTDVPPDVLGDYRFRGTPHTLVVDARGRAVESWIGAYRGRTATGVEAFFGARLPGLAARTAPGATGIR
jgi:hypothetical protein